ncbi:4-hydroxy-tetrahydrodipicolinate synthase [Ampullimonas aquatilis]|uniref:4-hydroxy-tetrahydrodipicolinate synthase n=1 Tax=Ampullimonas aquatilis TaxID=1341549 RepID=UPI003C7954EA
MITGSIVAIVTPMLEDGSLDWPAFRALIDWHIAEGTDALVVVGTTGESPTVTVVEHCELIKVAVEHAAKRIPIIAGTGGNSTIEAIELTSYAKQVGADASLQVVPYYNRPTQEGMYQHFKKIAESVDLPVILYNVPGRTVADMAHDTVVRLSAVPGIVGIKDATGNLERGCFLIRDVPADFAVYSGDDATAIALMLMGGKGNISVTANVAPRKMHLLCQAAMAGDVVTARAIHFELLGLHKNLFVEPNPVPVKWALQQMDKMSSGIRLPLVNLAPSYHDLLRSTLQSAGLLN